MNRLTRPFACAWLAAMLLLALGAATRVDADSTTTGPTVTANKTSVNPGDSVVLSISGFTEPSVTISVCGNEARRGSVDCNMSASEGLKLDGGANPTVAAMPVGIPPTTCPCVLRVSTRNNDEVAILPIVLIGHPIGPVAAGVALADPLAVTIKATPVSRGWLQQIRPSLGGPTKYTVTITVKNRSTEALHHVSVSASAGRKSDDNLVSLDLAQPGEIGVGKTWTETVTAVVPAPAFGDVQWRVAVSGAGPTVTVTDHVRHRPVLLMILAMLFVVNISALAIRFRLRRRVARDEQRNIERSEPIEATATDADMWHEPPVRVGVGG